MRYLLYLLGHPANENEFVRMVVNAGPIRLREETEPVWNDFLNRNFADGTKGELYRIDLEPWLNDEGKGDYEDATWTFPPDGNPAYCRNSWLKRTGETKDDYSHLLEFFKMVSRTNCSAAELESLIDAEAMLKMVAVRGYIGDWDNFTMQVGRNGYFYRRPSDGRFQFLHWDSDEGFTTGPSLYGKLVRNWVEQPVNLRRLDGYLQELIRLTVNRPERLRTWLEVEQTATQGGVRQADYLNFFRARAPEVLDAMHAHSLVGPAPAGSTHGITARAEQGD